MKTHRSSKFWIGFSVIVTVVIVFVGAKTFVNSALASVPKNATNIDVIDSNVDVGSVVDAAAGKIITGDFEGADELISKIQGRFDSRASQLSRIIEEYKVFSQERKAAKAKSYQDIMAEIEDLKNGVVSKDDENKDKAKVDIDADDLNEVSSDDKKKVDPEVKKMNEAFLKVFRAKEFADEKQKKELLSSDFVTNLISKSLAKAVEFEAKGEWIDAYAHCYYWLNVLFPDNKEYKDHAERLTRLAMIEMSLKDNSCEKAADRHEGIKAEMLLRTVRALDFSYVSLLDYKEMTQKALVQCRLLGQVLFEEKKDVPYRVSTKDMEQWVDGLVAIENILENSGGLPKTVKREDFIRIFTEVLALNTLTLNIPQEIVIAHYTEASLEALDPFTNLIWPWRVLDFQKNMTQDFTGIGVHISKIRGVLTVASLLPDTPAYHSNLDANDQILAVNGEETKDMTLTCVVSKITGPKGTAVTLTVRHEDAEEGVTEDINLVRDRIVVPTIRGWVREGTDGDGDSKGGTTKKEDSGKWGHMIDPINKIGYMRLTGFTNNTAGAMKAQLKNLEKRGMRGMIVDLRDNSGGYLSTAAEVVDMFIESGLIVKSQPRWGIATYERASKSGTHPDYPLVILINGSSASASEIVAGALQDEKYKRATLVGTRSYGKGSVQTIVPYSGEGSQLKYTMAYYHLPSNQRVMNRYEMEKEGRKDWGIAPDVEVEMTSQEVKKQRETQWSNDVLAKVGHHDKDGKPVKRFTAEETIAADPQMRVAIMVAQSKIIQAGGAVEFPDTVKPKSAVAGK